MKPSILQNHSDLPKSFNSKEFKRRAFYNPKKKSIFKRIKMWIRK